MREMIQEKICKFMLLILILSGVQNGLASDYPDFVGYVNDYAHLLSAPQASTLNQELRNFDNRTTIEVAMVTVDSIGSESPQDYATNIANYWGVGKRDKNNGILFLAAMQSHDIWIEVGPGLAGQFSDSQVQQIVDDVIIPRFRADQPDLGIIDGVHSIISHFEGSSISQTSKEAISSQQGSIQDLNFLKVAATAILLALLVIFSTFGIARWGQTKKNKTKINDLKKLLNELVDREASALDALKELKANYVSSVWTSAEMTFNLLDHEKLELELLNAERTSNRGFISARTAQSQINELENSFENAKRYVEAPISKLAEVKSAQQECHPMLAGLEAAFIQTEKETAGTNISMATRMNLETARHNFQEAVIIAKMPDNSVDWIELYERLVKLRNSVEQISKDAVRDQAIADKIQGQDPDEMLAKMRQTLDEAEKKLGKSSVALPDLEAARDEYDRAKYYGSGKVNTIDLYLINININKKIEHGYQHHQQMVKEASKREKEWGHRDTGDRATSVHHTGFGSSGSRSFGGGRMGGGSRGGGKW
jgi:uncharacterized membrane protein YgcG